MKLKQVSQKEFLKNHEIKLGKRKPIQDYVIIKKIRCVKCEIFARVKGHSGYEFELVCNA